MRNSLLHSQKIYDPNDSALLSEQEHCMGCLYDYNTTRPSEKEKRTQLLHTMLAECGKGCWIEPPFHANWGWAASASGQQCLCQLWLDLRR